MALFHFRPLVKRVKKSCIARDIVVCRDAYEVTWPHDVSCLLTLCSSLIMSGERDFSWNSSGPLLGFMG